MKNLIIVESPAKAKTIEKFLGKDYTVKSSIGHIRDMPKKDMGIDIDNNFEPKYEVSSDKRKIVANLRKSTKTHDKVWLATDEDREGEAIAWHLSQVLNLADDTPRIVFNEITKQAVIDAIKKPRVINKKLVDAQQARRILDRLVGFEISPVLWRKISGARSAGRVQSAVVKLVVDREREIQSFSPKSTYKITAVTKTKDSNLIEVKLDKEFADEDIAHNFIKDIINANLTISDVKNTPTYRSPKPPFITSTLQQEASQKLGFSVKQTMSLAQDLYRNGHISYMRTDSLNLSETAINDAKNVINSKFGSEYSHPRRYKTKSSSAQEAHEAIRPTNLKSDIIKSLAANELKLYKLIYNRTIASQMSVARLEKTTIKINISNRNENFIASGEVLKFGGFLKIYGSNNDDKLLPKVKLGEELELDYLIARESFSKHKPRYIEASLVKKIEDMGIGRPSTFATMVSTVQDRGYVVKESREGSERKYHTIEIKDKKIITSKKTETIGSERNKLFPTNVAFLLVDFLSKYFSNIVNYKFTANLEQNFDKIANENKKWQEVVKEFYKDFHPKIGEALEAPREETHNERELGIDSESGKLITVRFGRYGAFAQIGSRDDEEKPKFASLKKQQNIETITLEEVLELFKMPRVVGETNNGETIRANYGRFGPYLHYGKKYVSLKDISPETVTLEEALELITQKEKFDAERIIKTFKDSDIQILNGRFGPYIWNGLKKGKGQKNITIKKIFADKDPKTLTLNECKKAISGKLVPAKKPRLKKT